MSAQGVGSSDLKRKAALGSVLASGALTVIKLVAGIVSGSLALLSEAVHGAVDTGATIVTLLAVRMSDKPADDDHHFGHEKIEALAAMFEVFLLVDVSLVVVIEAVRRLRADVSDVEVTPWIFGVLLLSIGVDLFRWRSLRRIAKETGSDALAADAVHFSSDLVGTSIVLVGLVAYAAGWHRADALASFGVAAFIAAAAFQLARKTIETLLDKAPEGIAPRARELALAVPGVTDVEEVRLRRLGGRTVGDMTIGVSRTAPSDRIAAVRQDVVAALQEVDPSLDIVISAVPRMLDDETIVERVLLVAARRRLAIHHIMLQRVGETMSISFDLELDGTMSHGAAHEIATSLEMAIRSELGGDVEVESHIEPLAAERDGQDATPERVAAVEQRLIAAAKQGGTIFDVHKVRARATADGLVVNFHCRIDPTLSVSAAHDCVDALEHAVRSEDAEIVRLVGHAEPPRIHEKRE